MAKHSIAGSKAKRIVLILLALALASVFFLTGCKEGKDDPSTTVGSQTDLASEPGEATDLPLPVDGTTLAPGTTGLTDTTISGVSGSDVTVTGVTGSDVTTVTGLPGTTKPGASVPPVVKPPLPKTKAEILAAYTKVVDKVKIDMPQYTSNDWQTMSNVDMSGALYTAVSPFTKGALETKEQSTPGTQTKGTHPKWFALPTSSLKKGCVLTDTSKIESASCKQSGKYYIITITLKQEKDPAMKIDDPYNAPGWHGRMFDVIDIVQVVEVAKGIPFVNADNAYCNFKGTATLKYDPITNRCVTLDHVIDVRVFLGGSAKVIADYHFYDFKW